MDDLMTKQELKAGMFVVRKANAPMDVLLSSDNGMGFGPCRPSEIRRKENHEHVGMVYHVEVVTVPFVVAIPIQRHDFCRHPETLDLRRCELEQVTEQFAAASVGREAWDTIKTGFEKPA